MYWGLASITVNPTISLSSMDCAEYISVAACIVACEFYRLPVVLARTSEAEISKTDTFDWFVLVEICPPGGKVDTPELKLS